MIFHIVLRSGQVDLFCYLYVGYGQSSSDHNKMCRWVGPGGLKCLRKNEVT